MILIAITFDQFSTTNGSSW